MDDQQTVRRGIPVGPSGQIAAAEWTRERLAQFGVPFPPGNRLQRARALLEDVNAKRISITNDDILLERLNEAQWTIIEQYIITRSLGRPGRELSAERRRKLEEMLSGAEDAAAQIRTSNLSGVVAVNVDVLLKTSPDLPSPEATLAERPQVVEQIESRMADRQEVVATMTFGRDCVWDFDGARPVASISHSIRFTVHPRTLTDEATGREFFERLMARVEDRMDTL